MDDATTPDLGGLITRTLAIDVRDGGGVAFDDQGRQVYTALAYRYDEVDTYGTTLARGAMAHVVADDFRILEYHNAAKDPVGKPVSVTETDAGPVVRFVFADTERAQELRRLVDGGFLRAVSVGFIPTDGYLRGDGVAVFTRADLHELSLVNTPASKGALISLARDLGTDPGSLTALFGELPDDERDADEMTFEPNEAEARACGRCATCTCDAAGAVTDGALSDLDDVIDALGFDRSQLEAELDAEIEAGTRDLDEPVEEAATVETEAARTLRAVSLVRRHRR
jgi:HK97 family phage prohead protease